MRLSAADSDSVVTPRLAIVDCRRFCTAPNLPRSAETEFTADLPPTLLRCERYLAGAFRRGAEVWPVFSLRSLLESQQFLQAAAS